MAFQSNNPIMVMFPPFRGLTRRIVLTGAVISLASLAVQIFVSEELDGLIRNFFLLHPAKALTSSPFQLITYPFAGNGVLSEVLALVSLWLFASGLEDERGQRWLGELLLAATIVGGAFAVVISRLLGEVKGLGTNTSTGGYWPAVMALVVAYGVLHANEMVRFNFILPIKAKYLAAIYLLFYVPMAAVSGGRFEALTALCNAMVAYGFVKLAPRRGVRARLSERWFAMRNSMAKAKRRRAAKKFTVYMRKQGKDVSLDEDGRYVDPDGKPRDPNDRNWMN